MSEGHEEPRTQPNAEAVAAPEPAPAAGDATAATPAGSMSADTAALLGLIDRLGSLLERSELVELEVEAGETGIVLRKPSALMPTTQTAAVAPVAATDLAVGTSSGSDRGEGSAEVAAPVTMPVGQGAPHRHLLRLPVADLAAVRDRRAAHRRRPGHRAHRGDEALQRDQVRPGRSGGPDRAPESGSW